MCVQRASLKVHLFVPLHRSLLIDTLGVHHAAADSTCSQYTLCMRSLGASCATCKSQFSMITLFDPTRTERSQASHGQGASPRCDCNRVAV